MIPIDEKKTVLPDYLPVEAAALDLEPDNIYKETEFETEWPLPVPVSPFTAVHVPAGRIAFFEEIDRPRYTFPPAPLSRDLQGDTRNTKVKTPPQIDKVSETPAQKEISAEMQSESARKPSAVPAVKIPAAAPASRAPSLLPSKEAPAKETAADTAVPKRASVLPPAASRAGADSGTQGNFQQEKVQQNTGLPVVSAPPAQKDKAETVYYSRPGIIEILLDRQGWIYAGEKEGRKGLAFESKENLPGNPGSTQFRFSVKDEGPYKMVFQLQDRSGRSEVSEIDLKKGTAENPGPEDKEPDIDNSSLLSLFSTVREETGKDGAVEKDDITEKIIKAAVLQASGRNYEKAIEMLEIIPGENPDYAQMDTVYFLLGQYYEADSIKRNASRAVHYYGKLIDEFPLSSRVYDAESRIKYLEKHFIHIR